MTRLAIISTHPIQYNAPAFRELATKPGIDLRVFYEWVGPGQTLDREFGQPVQWDIPLLDGYEFSFVPNTSRDPGTHHFWGINNPELLPAVRAWAPDVVLVYGWRFASHLRLLGAVHGKTPVMFRGDSTLLDMKPRAHAMLRKAALNLVFRNIDVSLYAGIENRKYCRFAGLRDDQLFWAPHAVDNQRFAVAADVCEADAFEWRRALGILDNEFVFLFAGKLVRRKDPSLLLRAFAALDHVKLGPAHLVFAGSGKLYDALREEASRFANVHFIGFQNQSVMPTVYRIGNMIVLPSREGETWGLAVNEAMACGRPVLVSDKVGCAADLVDPGHTGFVFESGALVALHRTMAQILGDKEKVQAMGRRSRERIALWSIEAYARAVATAASALGLA